MGKDLVGGEENGVVGGSGTDRGGQFNDNLSVDFRQADGEEQRHFRGLGLFWDLLPLRGCGSGDCDHSEGLLGGRRWWGLLRSRLAGALGRPWWRRRGGLRVGPGEEDVDHGLSGHSVGVEEVDDISQPFNLGGHVGSGGFGGGGWGEFHLMDVGRWWAGVGPLTFGG